MSTPRESYKLKDAATATGISVDQLRKEIQATPPRLRAKKLGRDLVILAADLREYLKNLPDADS